MSNFLTALRKNASFSSIINRLLVALLMVAMSASIVQVAHQVAPAFPAGYLPWVAFFVSIESMVSRATLRRMRGLEMSPLTFHLIEAVVLLVLLKLIQYLWTGPTQILKDIPQWSHNFFVTFFTPGYIFASLVMVVVWGLSLWYARDLEELEDDQILIESGGQEGFHSDRAGIRTSIAQRIFVVGLLLTILTVGLETDLISLLKGTLAVHRTGAFNLLIYFILGLLFLSQVQFSILRAGWAWERIQIDARMAQRWVIAGGISLILVAAVAFLLPTHYSMGLLATLGYLVNILVWIIMAGISLLFLPIGYLLNFLLNLFPKMNNEIPPLQLPEVPPPPPEIANPAAAPWTKILQSILFWSIFLAVILFAFYQYIKQNRELIAKFKRFKGFILISKALLWLKERIQGINQGVASAVRAGLQRLRQVIGGRSGVDAGFDYVNPRRMNPRQQVMFFYLALVRRSQDAGLPREPSQTPYEYARRLDRNLPEVTESVDAMTEAFMEARYSRHEIPPSQVSRVRQWWEQVRKLLKDRIDNTTHKRKRL